MKIATTTLPIYDGSHTPQDNAHVYVLFENGFECVGYYHAETNNIHCGAYSYQFIGVKSWFNVPNECL